MHCVIYEDGVYTVNVRSKDVRVLVSDKQPIVSVHATIKTMKYKETIEIKNAGPMVTLID